MSVPSSIRVAARLLVLAVNEHPALDGGGCIRSSTSMGKRSSDTKARYAASVLCRPGGLLHRPRNLFEVAAHAPGVRPMGSASPILRRAVRRATS